ncbi:MAG TPA: alanine racemase [Gammaproteobacteria bacterium]|nr:alanine racemase [Gammaproteobacteria bacterium]
MSRAARAIIDTRALQHNLRRIRELAPGRRVMAVIKANAYGHGIVPVARALAAADAFAVACTDEALAVRAAGLPNRIVLLEGVFSADELAVAARENLEVVVHSPEQLAWLAAFHGGTVDVWLKIDTGMNRLGFRVEDTRAAWQRLQELPAVRKPVRLMTHLANADDPDGTRTAEQLARFTAVTRDLPGERSIANSAGTLAWPESHADWVRPGLALYGVSPFAGRTGADEGLVPAMTMLTELHAVKTVRRGESVGYGGSWTAAQDTRIGVAAIGYGDGYPRHAGNGTPVLVNGQRVSLVGRVSMDMITVELGAQPQAKVGDPVELWGAALPVEQIAAAAGTVPYELLCGVTQRVRFEVR